MKLRLFHTTDLNVQGTQVYPLGKKIYSEELEDEEIFYRRKFKGEYIFENRNDIQAKSNDFDFLIAFENDLVERCRTRYIVVEKYCDGNWINFHVGKFTFNDADFDLDKCSISLKVETVDDYSCILANKELEFNMLATGPIVSTTAPRDIPYEFILCREDCSNIPCGVPDPAFWRLFHNDCNNVLLGSGVMIYERNQNNLLSIDISDTYAIFGYSNGGNCDLIRLDNGALITLGSFPASEVNHVATDGNYAAFTTSSNSFPQVLRLRNIMSGVLTTLVSIPQLSTLYFDFCQLKGNYILFHVNNSSGSASPFQVKELRLYNIATTVTTIIRSEQVFSPQLELSEVFFNGDIVVYREPITNQLRRFNCVALTNILISAGVTPIYKAGMKGDYLVYYRVDTDIIYKYKISTSTLTSIVNGVTNILGYSFNEKYYCYCDATMSNILKYYDLDTDTNFNTTIVANIQVGSIGNSNDFITFHNVNNNIIVYDIALNTQSVIDSDTGAARILMNNNNTAYYLNSQTDIIRDYNIIENVFTQVRTGIVSMFAYKKNDSGQFISINDSANDNVTVWGGSIPNPNKAKIWFRELKRTVCLGGLPTPPIGSGWAIESNDCGVDGTTLYKRWPQVSPASVGTIYEGTCICGMTCVPVPPIGISDLILIGDCNGNSESSYWLKTVDDIIYSRNRWVQNVIEFIIGEICPEINGVKSDFFQWNPDNISPLNYVTGQFNQLEYLTIAQKSDIRTPNSSEAATIGMLTLENFINWFRLMFNVYWYVENDYIYFEHISKIQNVIGLDLTIPKYKIWAEKQNRYSYDKAKMPRIERFRFMEQDTFDFVGFPIEYKDSLGEWSLCVTNDTQDYAAELITTDLPFIQISPSAIDLKGFVMFANQPNGLGGYSVRLDIGIISGTFKVNSALSWSTLHNNYLKYRRVLKEGNMNNVFTNFITAIRIKQQKEFRIPFCCGDSFEPEDLILTNLGEGEVDGAEFDFENDKLQLKIKY